MLRLLDPRLWKMIGSVVVGAIVIALIGSAVFATGTESYEIDSAGRFSGSKWGMTFGSKTFYLREGQVFDASYDVVMKKGELNLSLSNQLWGIPKNVVARKKIASSERGHFRVVINESGWYRFRSTTWPSIGEYSVHYTTSWRAISPP